VIISYYIGGGVEFLSHFISFFLRVQREARALLSFSVGAVAGWVLWGWLNLDGSLTSVHGYQPWHLENQRRGID
jgi:hypothetical protein